MAGCRAECTGTNFLLKHDNPKLFVTSQWPTPPVIYVIYRVAIAIYFFVWLVVSGVQFGNVIWFQYLTYWSFLLLNCSIIYQMALSIWGYVIIRRAQENPAEFASQRWFIQLGWFLYNAVSNACLIITAVYWSLLYDPSSGFEMLDFHVHGMNTIYVLVDLFIIATPFRLLHFYHGMVYLMIYQLFSVAYTLTTGVVVYPILMWDEKPANAAMYSCIIVFVLCPLAWLILCGLYRLRMALYYCCFSKKETVTSSREELDMADRL